MDENEVYSRLCTLIANRSDRVLTFETLSFAPEPLQVDGEYVGITKKALIKAFLKARATFFGFIRRQREENVVPYPETVLLMTSIILLYDTEFLTAVNWRKNWLIHQLQTGDRELAVAAVSRELSFTASLLASPMHRTAKSPMIWFHRLWILQMLLEEGRQLADLLQSVAVRTMDAEWGFSSNMLEHTSHIPRTAADHPNLELVDFMRVWRYELSLVQRAGENHPHNYYAWKHLRHIFDCVKARSLVLGVIVDGSTTEEIIAEAALTQTQRWCMQHPRDVSGWSFLQFLLHHIKNISLQHQCVKQTIDYARKIGWEGEGLWRFVDSITDQFNIDNELSHEERQADIMAVTEKENEGETITIERNRWKRWIASHGIQEGHE